MTLSNIYNVTRVVTFTIFSFVILMVNKQSNPKLGRYFTKTFNPGVNFDHCWLGLEPLYTPIRTIFLFLEGTLKGVDTILIRIKEGIIGSNHRGKGVKKRIIFVNTNTYVSLGVRKVERNYNNFS